MHRPLTLLAGACLLLVCARGCTTPSFPLPPPEPGAIEFQLTVVEEKSFASVAGQANVDHGFAKVVVYDRDTGEGAITTARADGSFGPTVPFPAFEGDAVEIVVERGSESRGICLILRQGRSSPANLCSP
jgi:hypothetical protein